MKTHIAIPKETFNKVMNIIGQLPFVQVSEVFEEVRSGFWYSKGNIPVIANVTKSEYISSPTLPYPLVGGKKYTANLYDGTTLKFSREMMVGP